MMIIYTYYIMHNMSNSYANSFEQSPRDDRSPRDNRSPKRRSELFHIPIPLLIRSPKIDNTILYNSFNNIDILCSFVIDACDKYTVPLENLGIPLQKK
jgi:hypothetical protein